MADLKWFQMLRVTAIGGLYSATAGFTNAVSLGVIASSMPVAHMTGITTTLAQAVAQGTSSHYNGTAATLVPSSNGSSAWEGALAPIEHGRGEVTILLAFLVGAMVSGAIVGSSLQHRLQVSTRYGVGLVLESVLLAIALGLTFADRLGAAFFAAAAMGLQNGMTTIYSGALLRSTHVTGVWTDIGVLIGQYIHQLGHHYFGDPENRILVNTELWRFRFLVPIMAGFLGGTIAGGLSFLAIGQWSFAVSIFLTATSGGLTIAYDTIRQVAIQRTVQKRVYESLRTKRSSSMRGGDESTSAPSTLLVSDSAGSSSGGGGDVGGDFMDDRDEHQETEDYDFVIAEALTARGDWDALQHTMEIRNAARNLVSQRAYSTAERRHSGVSSGANHSHQSQGDVYK